MEEELQAQEQMSVAQNNPIEPQTELSPYDTQGDIAELEGLQKELSDIEASIEHDFATHIANMVDNDSVLEELFFSDRITFFKKVIEEQNNFTKALIEPRMQRAQELGQQIAGKQEMGKIDAAREAFQAAHPDVDIQELVVFFTQEVPPKAQEEIKALPIEEFFEAIYQLYMQAQGAIPQEQAQEAQEALPQQEELPAQASGVPVSSEDADSATMKLPMYRN